MHVGMHGRGATISLADLAAELEPDEEFELPACPAGGQWATDTQGGAVLLALDEIPEFCVPEPVLVVAQASRLASGRAEHEASPAGGPGLTGEEHEAFAAREGTRLLEALSCAAANRDRCPSQQTLARISAVRPWVKPSLATYPEVARHAAAARLRRAFGLMIATEEQEAAPATVVRSASAMEAAIRIRGSPPAATSGDDA